MSNLQQVLDNAELVGLPHIILPSGQFEEENELAVPNFKFCIFHKEEDVREFFTNGKTLTVSNPIYKNWFMTAVYTKDTRF